MSLRQRLRPSRGHRHGCRRACYSPNRHHNASLFAPPSKWMGALGSRQPQKARSPAASSRRALSCPSPGGSERTAREPPERETTTSSWGSLCSRTSKSPDRQPASGRWLNIWGGEIPGGGFRLRRAHPGHLPRRRHRPACTAREQFDAGPPVPARQPLETGDLVFFGTSDAAVDHVGIRVGTQGSQSVMADAPNAGADGRVEPFPASVEAALVPPPDLPRRYPAGVTEFVGSVVSSQR